jgi:prepilin-type N-terminal cleavage/methylation domain-containing protein
MQDRQGFTLIELMIVIGIVGILSASAVPVYRTWQNRARGSEAAIMAKQILDAEIMYYLDNDRFYPDDSTIDILHGHDSEHENVIGVKVALNMTIPTGHFLEYYLASYNDDEGIYTFQLTINSLESRFEIFDGVTVITYKMDKNGNISSYTL